MGKLCYDLVLILREIMKLKDMPTLRGIAIVDEVKKAADDFDRQRKANEEKAALHAKVYRKIDTLELTLSWAKELRSVVNELLGREFMDAASVLVELEKDKPIQVFYSLKLRLDTAKRKSERAVTIPDIKLDRRSIPPGSSTLPPSDSSIRVQRGASGLNDRVRTLLGPLLEGTPADQNKTKK